jgi:hypothetical protein
VFAIFAIPSGSTLLNDAINNDKNSESTKITKYFFGPFLIVLSIVLIVLFSLMTGEII